MTTHPTRALLLCLVLASHPAMAEELPAPVQAPANAVAPPPAPTRAVSKAGLLPRAVVELLAGSAGGFVGASLGFTTGVLVSLPERRCADDRECLGPAFIGTAVGIVAGIPLGVWAGGALLGSRSGVLPALGGSAVGWGATLLLANALRPAGGTVSTGMGLALLMLPVLGATVGSEWAHASAERNDSRPPVSVTPLLTLGPNGGRLGLAGAF